jgi:hypothetical protein
MKYGEIYIYERVISESFSYSRNAEKTDELSVKKDSSKAV